MKDTTWLDKRVAVGPLRKGRRGWFVLGPRPADGRIAPIVAHGVLDEHGVTVNGGVLAPRFRVLLLAEAAP